MKQREVFREAESLLDWQGERCPQESCRSRASLPRPDGDYNEAESMCYAPWASVLLNCSWEFKSSLD